MVWPKGLITYLSLGICLKRIEPFPNKKALSLSRVPFWGPWAVPVTLTSAEETEEEARTVPKAGPTRRSSDNVQQVGSSWLSCAKMALGAVRWVFSWLCPFSFQIILLKRDAQEQGPRVVQ